ncbi:(d)CMP kinase [Kingella negevensis]|uniref:(d)CMP kinase n=1 Tax=Kingella negevensis TaxID=1522312 RepID=UPI00050A326E|nr:(d)CMP kinase [Kingella negevensis]MDK4688014.1 (d)CMP kinase [Kingella negevensis]WII91002.1 (d)CMP kinase [Kingella negevensis]
MQKVIAIDGPSASGKGTIAARVAATLGWAYLDSGSLYRLTALHAEQNQITWTDETAIAQLATTLPVEFAGQTVLLAGNDVSQAIRSEHIGMGASAVAKLPAVRSALLQRQRDFLTEQGLVADGRDMGSIVFPEAQLKIFLTASAQIRAERRAKQINVPLSGCEFEQILTDIEARDEADKNRPVAPLRQLPDAKLLDTSNLGIEETVAQVLAWYEKSK